VRNLFPHFKRPAPQSQERLGLEAPKLAAALSPIRLNQSKPTLNKGINAEQIQHAKTI
jgi:hypothetical protein